MITETKECKIKELNTIIHSDFRYNSLSNECIDLVVTSPPYDNIRAYNGIPWNYDIFKEVANELYRVLKPGGCIVWVVDDQIKDYNRSSSSLRQTLYFQDIGFNHLDNLIFCKKTPRPCVHYGRYQHKYEYINVFCKPTIIKKKKINRPNTFNPIENVKSYLTIKRDRRGRSLGDYYKRKDDNNKEVDVIELSPYKPNNKKTVLHKTIFEYPTINYSKGYEFLKVHPARFHIFLAKDMIYSYSNEQDVVLDPFMGSGTTAHACLNINRHYIGYDINEEYINLANKRIEKAKEERQTDLFDYNQSRYKA